MSSPISEWPSSPDTQKSSTENILTPSRRVQALLARFEDSESEQEIFRLTQKKDDLPTVESRSKTLATARLSASGEGEDEDNELPLAPRGRLAARLQAARTDHQENASSGEDNDKAYTRVREQIQQANANASKMHKPARSSEDELSRPAPRRRLLNKKSSPNLQADQDLARSPSTPLYFPSPSAVRKSPVLSHAASQSDSDEMPESLATGGKSKFLALVEKHRKQRLAKEAAEMAKKAAREDQLKEQSGRSRGPRGSSPADESEEDSDISKKGAGKSLTQDRPARKASKRALEEMKRETQRMSRNMQLAHQARTRKKITKESLLEKFNFSVPRIASAGPNDDSSKSSAASSAPASDVEAAKEHVTPPTSPLQEDTFEKVATNQLQTTMEVDHTVYNLRDEELPSLEDILTKPISKVDKGKGRAIKPSSEPNFITSLKKDVRPIRVKWSKEDAVIARAADSGSDLEIITSQSKSRKYAAFESLPKRKAKEKQSHLVLRSLANLIGSDDKKRSSMNAAEMEMSLRKAAREQARRERQEKIEELKAKGVVIQTSEEREREQQEVEDLVERARQEAAEIQKREKALAKKDGTFVKDGLEDESEDEEDSDFQEEDGGQEVAEAIDSDDHDDEEDDTREEEEEEEDDGGAKLENEDGHLIDQEADEQGSDEESEEAEDDLSDISDMGADDTPLNVAVWKSRKARVVSDDEDEENQSPTLPAPSKTPQSLPRSARKIIPGLQMSDNLPMGLTQAFAATLADSQTQDDTPSLQEQDSLDLVRDLPSAMLPFTPKLNRLESIDMVSDSQPASQTQPLNIDLSFSQLQGVPQSPIRGLDITGRQFTPSQLPFEPTQDGGYMLTPFAGSRFDAATPQHQAPNSTVDTVILPNNAIVSPIMQRKGRLTRGRAAELDEEDVSEPVEQDKSAFEVMRRAATQKAAEPAFDRTKSAAKDVVDEAAEESEDEYAGLGGASDDDAGEENEDDRKMIDEDTQVGRGDEAKLAGLFADRERKQDEAAVSKLLKDITTGALRRKRGVGDDLDLSDEEDAAARRREAKRREFAKMRRELLKDEAVGKIAQDQKKEAFLRSIEDRDEVDEDDSDFDGQDMPVEDESQSQSAKDIQDSITSKSQYDANPSKRPLEATTDSALNRLQPVLRRKAASVTVSANKRPTTLAEIRESVSFLIEEPDSQSIDLGLSDSEEEPEAYVDLDRHFHAADENAEDDAEDLGDFIVDDDGDADVFKKPELPRRNSDRAPFGERRTKPRANVVDRLQLLRQASSSSASASSNSSGGAKMAFFTNRTSSTDALFSKVPSLLRRATSNSSFGTMAGRGEEISATGVVTAGNRTERGSAEQEKEFIRKGTGGRRNAVNYTAREKPGEAMSRKAGVVKSVAAKKMSGKRGAGGFLGGLFGGDSWG
jgi:mediator of replication checkpoint protein 1